MSRFSRVWQVSTINAPLTHVTGKANLALQQIWAGSGPPPPNALPGRILQAVAKAPKARGPPPSAVRTQSPQSTRHATRPVQQRLKAIVDGVAPMFTHSPLFTGTPSHVAVPRGHGARFMHDVTSASGSPSRARATAFTSKFARSAGPRPMPLPRQYSGHTLGLGTARTFSSGQLFTQDVVRNAPLIIRALAHELDDGVDERKWLPSRAARLFNHGQAAPTPSTSTRQTLPLFDSTSSFTQASRMKVATTVTEDGDEEEVKYFAPAATSSTLLAATFEPSVRLLLPLQPTTLADVLYGGVDDVSPHGLLHASDWRLWADLEADHALHARREIGVWRRLQQAGLLDSIAFPWRLVLATTCDPTTTAAAPSPLPPGGGRVITQRTLIIELGKPCTMMDVRQALEIWSDDQRLWYKVQDLSTPPPSSPTSSDANSDSGSLSPLSLSPTGSDLAFLSSPSPPLSPRDPNGDVPWFSLSHDADEDWHDAIASAYIMPTVSLSAHFMAHTMHHEEGSEWDGEGGQDDLMDDGGEEMDSGSEDGQEDDAHDRDLRSFIHQVDQARRGSRW